MKTSVRPVIAAAIATVVLLLHAGVGRTQPSSLRPASELGMALFAKPLGLWCDGTSRFTVGIINQGDATVHIGVPVRPDSRFPYKFSTEWGDHGSGTGMGCECGSHIDCDMCARPDVVAALPSGTELTWVLEFGKVLPPRFIEGPTMFRLSMNWYGGVLREDAQRQKVNGNVDVALEIERVSDRCFLSRVKNAG
jgi:hypothetical protein